MKNEEIIKELFERWGDVKHPFIPKYGGEYYTVLAKDKEEAYGLVYEYLCKMDKDKPYRINYDILLNYTMGIINKNVNKEIFHIEVLKTGEIIKEE